MLDGIGLTNKQVDLTKNFFALGLMFWLYERSMDPTLSWIDDKFSARPLDLQYHWSVRGWTTDHVLRPGESLTRWWHNQGGRWHHSPTYVGWMRELLEKPPRGIKPNHADFSIWGVGSALLLYQPDLTETTRDVELGARDIRNLQTSARGLTLAEAGRGWIVFEVLSPYVIVPVMDDLDDPDNDNLNRDAATVMVSTASADR